MIQIKDVRKAIKLYKSHFSYSKGLHLKLADTLDLYSGRGEFDGSLISAIECLTLAGYKIQALEPQGDTQDEG